MTEIRFEYLGSLDSGKKFRIQFQVQNPIFVSERTLKIFYHSKNNNRIQENIALSGFFTVSPISILQGGVAYYWGLSQELDDVVPNGVFHQQAVGGLGGPLNSLKISFKIATPVPVGAQFELFMDVDATHVLEESIFNNLPQFYDNKLSSCTFLSK
jgi:hypothetical protein